MHKALYRMFRPMTFSDVVGQEHITRTLKNQIANDNTAHAYLFCGTRGTGKTSTAKIFARSINCISPVDFEPCNSCEICTGIIEESIMDVVEIDAASNNGVDDVRELRENVKYPPSRGKYKVYIIDEVHMLSQGAFNALLKTLEEPPPYVVFILATTEAHKLPATILSRCQRFEFKRIGMDDAVQRMRHVCEQTGVQADDDALSLIAMSSQGAMRDALSVLDQCISYTSECIRYDDVVSLLGTVDYQTISSMSGAIVDSNIKACLEIVNEAVVWGKDLRHFIQKLIEHFRNIMVMQMGPSNGDMIQLTDHMKELVAKQSQSITPQEAIRNIKILSQVQNDMKYSTHPRIMLEVAAMKLCTPSEDESVEGLISRIARIESIVNKGGIQPSKPERQIEKQSPEKVETCGIAKASAEASSGAASKQKCDSYKCSEKTIDVSTGMDTEPLWKELLRVIKQDKKVPVQAMLKEGKPQGMEGSMIIVVFDDAFGFHKQALSKNETISYINGVLKRITGENMGIKLFLESEVNVNVQDSLEKDTALEMLEEIFPPEMIEIIGPSEE
ncbi:DNA polymerase-3 subunit gamma/tau [Peptoclostridium litorale DSM 5388]|uniref:DNA-directed DNA polymerase n=1 Tax=Peptoclostridium litorale DSM 5388 TaxID=1121324 RepID=A0A069RJW8_PEPLI|nr:DNA polymerase III subunit gamma/tau [Peptoclostridium litorale]KDR94522.1 DNA polymerase III subunit gamma/tau [Peptoclostridium litorale DSM 5388]SIO35203.1 DNA polymerase-3 subunit gamma/tau [Peptoclostridium litorale DSM 5388]